MLVSSEALFPNTANGQVAEIAGTAFTTAKFHFVDLAGSERVSTIQ
jgi:hypothetical protein